MGQKCSCLLKEGECNTEQKLENTLHKDMGKAKNHEQIDFFNEKNISNDNSLMKNKSTKINDAKQSFITYDAIYHDQSHHSEITANDSFIKKQNSKNILKDNRSDISSQITSENYREIKIGLIIKNFRRWFYKEKFIKSTKKLLIENNKILFNKLMSSEEIKKLIYYSSCCCKPYNFDDWQQFYSQFPINFQQYLTNENLLSYKIDPDNIFGRIYQSKKVFLGKNIYDYNSMKQKSIKTRENRFNYNSNTNEQEISNQKKYIYIGEVNKYNTRHGRGVLYYLDGCRREEGSWFEDKLVGWTRITYSNGLIMEGIFLNGFFDGKGRIYMIQENIYYEGDIKHNKKHGFGIETTSDRKYQGEFWEDQKSGKGSIFFTKSGDIFEGEFRENKMLNGKYTWGENGNVYIGYFSKNKMHGIGIYTTSAGQVYEGEYKDGKKNGYGIIKENNKIIYEGDFLEGNPHGKGFIYNKRGVKTEVNMDNGKKINENNNKSSVSPRKLGLKHKLINKNIETRDKKSNPSDKKDIQINK